MIIFLEEEYYKCKKAQTSLSINDICHFLLLLSLHEGNEMALWTALRIPISHSVRSEEYHFYVGARRNDQSISFALFFNCPSWITSNLSAAEVKSIWFQVINETFRPVIYPKQAKDLQCDI